ncbi:MAG: hypothetical protein QXU18_09475, partial [Thermoplasmatales archaeon]
MQRPAIVFVVALVVAFLFLLPSTTSFSGSSIPPGHSSGFRSPETQVNNSSLTFIAPSIATLPSAARLNGTWSSMLNYTIERMNGSSIPQIAKMLPNFNVPVSGKLITGPVYSSAPA